MELAENLIQGNNFSINTPSDWIHEFILQMQIKNPKIKKHYENILIHFLLFAGIEWGELSIQQAQLYLEYLKRVNKHKEFRESNLELKVKTIILFLTYLHERNLVNLNIVNPFKEYLDQRSGGPSKYKRNKDRSKKMNKTEKKLNAAVKPIPEIICGYLAFLENNQYSGVNAYKRRIAIFEHFLENNGVNINVFLEENKENLLFEQISKYEKSLSSRVSREEIILSTATLYLRGVQLFVKFLISKGLVCKKYTLPLHLRGRSKRANQFVPTERIIELMDTIYDHSQHVLRDLSIFLIILETGCRPIEVCNLTLQDLDKVERTLSFQCVKSERRKVQIDQKVMNVIKDYLEIRSNYDPNVENLLVNCSGNPITPSLINIFLYEINMHAFGEPLYPAKAFRHTFITNALEAYEFDRVSRTVGHKDWASTYYYKHRSTKRLLANTLHKNPI